MKGKIGAVGPDFCESFVWSSLFFGKEILAWASLDRMGGVRGGAGVSQQPSPQPGGWTHPPGLLRKALEGAISDPLPPPRSQESLAGSVHSPYSPTQSWTLRPGGSPSPPPSPTHPPRLRTTPLRPTAPPVVSPPLSVGGGTDRISFPPPLSVKAADWKSSLPCPPPSSLSPQTSDDRWRIRRNDSNENGEFGR